MTTAERSDKWGEIHPRATYREGSLVDRTVPAKTISQSMAPKTPTSRVANSYPGNGSHGRIGTEASAGNLGHCCPPAFIRCLFASDDKILKRGVIIAHGHSCGRRGSGAQARVGRGP